MEKIGLRRVNSLRRILLLAGLADAILLTCLHYLPRAMNQVCGELSGCTQVLRSPLATLGGVSLAILGALYYSVLILLEEAGKRNRAQRASELLTGVGVVFSGLLLSYQFFSLRTWCPMCVVSAVIIISLFLTTKQTDSTSSPTVIISLLIWAVGLSVMWFSSQTRLSTSTVDIAENAIYTVYEGRNSCRIMMLGDYECPHCHQMYSVVKELAIKHSVDFAYGNVPLPHHDVAWLAAMAADFAADQGKFTAFHENLMSKTTDISFRDIEESAAEVGLSDVELRSYLLSKGASQRLGNSLKWAESIEVDSVPAIFVNNRRVQGPSEKAGIENLLRDALN